PKSSPTSVAKQLENLGAKVLLEGEAWDDTDLFCRELCRKDSSLAYLPPFEHPMIWEGHSTIVDELAEQCKTPPDAIVLSVGGGGLLNGIALGLKRHGWNETKILAVETIGADSLYQAYEAGHLVTLPAITSIAKSLGAKCVSATALAHTQNGLAVPCQVTDEQAIQSSLAFADEERILVEPACGASLSLVYEQTNDLAPFHHIVVIVCGGAKVDLGMFDKWRKETYAIRSHHASNLQGCSSPI
ncbi:MAG: pyridoxal-phosphate dependent enzyme, partial [Selenomonadaceae bacterium]|nr:pyridoxal-phosphate dependent enzyme [Selenomonadaceae bacterium]